MRSNAPCGVRSCLSFCGFIRGGIDPRYTMPRFSCARFDFASALDESTGVGFSVVVVSSAEARSPN